MNPYLVRVVACAAAAGMLGLPGRLAVGAREPGWLVVLGLVGLTAAAWFGIGAMVFAVAARRWGALERGESVIARWSYDGKRWERFLESERARSRPPPLLPFVGASAACAAIATLAWVKGSVSIAAATGVVACLLCPLTAAFAISAAWVKLFADPMSDAIIGRNEIAFRGSLVRFRGRVEKLESVAVEDGDLRIRYLAPSGKYGVLRTFTVRVPVPNGRAQEAAALASRLEAEVTASVS